MESDWLLRQMRCLRGVEGKGTKAAERRRMTTTSNLQDRKFAGLDCQSREQEEADQEADGRT